MAMLDEAIREKASDSRDRSFMGKVRDIIPWKGDDIREIIRKLVFITAMCVLCYSAYDAYIYNFGSKDMINDQRELANLYNPNSQTASSDSADSTPDVTSSTPNTDPSADSPVPDDSSDLLNAPEVSKYPAGMNPDFNDLYDINPDVVGWLFIDDIYVDDSKEELAINNAVVQTTDNDYYLEHDYYGAERNYGALFVDYNANPFSPNRSSNVTIYGHNMKVGRFFHHLHDYKKGAQFVSDHRIVHFNTLYSNDEYIIFACFLVSVNEEDDNQPLFRYHTIHELKTDVDFDYWYKNVMYRNYYKTDIDCDISDEYLTLSTCSTEINDSRFVVVARKLRPGEDPSVYNYRSNSKAHRPAKLYIATGNEVPTDSGPDYEIYQP